MHILERWELDDIKRNSDRAVSRLYELDSLRSDVGSLEHSIRQLRAEIHELRAQVSTLQDGEIARLTAQIEELQGATHE